MNIFFAFLMGFTAISAIPKDTWKICLDKKVLLNTSEEHEEKNIIKIFSSDLKKSRLIIVSYKEESPQLHWERSILVFDEKDNELKKQTGKKLSIKTAELKTILVQSKTIKVYTLYSPTDPKMKSQVRLRRVHLCTLVLQ